MELEKGTLKRINELLVIIFNDILEVEIKTLRSGSFSDIGVTEMHAIEQIGKRRGRTMSEVAQDLGVTMGTLTQTVQKLVRKGYVIRERVPEDRRLVLLKLTARGRLAHSIHGRFHDVMVLDIVKDMDEEDIERLLGVLESVHQTLKTKSHEADKGVVDA